MLAPTLIRCFPLLHVKLSVREIVLLTMYPTQSGVAILGIPAILNSARPCVAASLLRFPLGSPKLLFQFCDWLARLVRTLERLNARRTSFVFVSPSVRKSDTCMFWSNVREFTLASWKNWFTLVVKRFVASRTEYRKKMRSLLVRSKSRRPSASWAV